MSTVRTRDVVGVRVDGGGLPDRLEWNGRRYRVSDRPTVWTLGLTIGGWRFQGTDDAGDSRVFDVSCDGDRDQWRLIAVYD